MPMNSQSPLKSPVNAKIRGLASDNEAGVDPEIMKAILAANQGHAHAYSEDEWTRLAMEQFHRNFGADCQVFFTFGGTGSNVFALACLCRSFETIFCSSKAHLYHSECGAVENFIGSKLVPIETADGHLRPQDIESYLYWQEDVHASIPRVISITQSTELGTVYRPQEILALVEYAHQHGMRVHMDGTRLVNAAASLNCSLGALTTELGVDAISFGGTKNGLLMGEAVIFPNSDPSLSRNFSAIWKQSMQMPSKARFIAAQFLALLKDDHWLQNASHENKMAKYLAEQVSTIPEVEIVYPVETNAVFAKIPPNWIKALVNVCHFYVWDSSTGLVRWMTNFDTQPEDIDLFIDKLSSLSMTSVSPENAITLEQRMSREQAKDISETRPWLSRICDSQSTEELKTNYDSWANTYDVDVREDWSFMPANIARTLSKLLPNKDATILDAGAGTGLVGQALAQQGYTNLTAADLSEKMLAIAKERQVYKALHQCNLEDSQIFSNLANFDAIIAAGVFAYAHAGVKVLNNLFCFLKEEGIFLLTIREDYRREMQTALDKLPWTLVSEEDFPIYDEARLMYLLGLKKRKINN
ncbi:beta-eliminating lyase-related protein [Moorena sp. SIO4G3]|uniref:beta-eliminating lyase-related protein n=1 Tax=Moorena sp. SIO4G3 TaxID=2607821 RepID=UPI00142BDEAC|nr:beta-eliminating lyase-related protein [Moorena sp. SIO4G3]NEO80256.1 aminotransferase class V-fold PLP-dependent enzyme [Moorena sp. SIO4G3]